MLDQVFYQMRHELHNSKRPTDEQLSSSGSKKPRLDTYNGNSTVAPHQSENEEPAPP